jgi:2-isopropylmalate synthase
MRRKKKAVLPDIFVLKSFEVRTGSDITATATVCLRKTRVIEDAATGRGPVHAAFNAIDRITGNNAELIHYMILGKDKEGRGQAIVILLKNGKTFVGESESRDIIWASISAYLMAVNRILLSRA